MIELFASSPTVFLVTTFVIGLIVGSFLNVVIMRLPVMMEHAWQHDAAAILGQEAPAEPESSLVSPGSACPTCGTPIKAWHNIPVLGYLWLRGHCAACGARISPQYPLVELATGILSLAVAWQFGVGVQVGLALIATWFLIALTGIDWRTQFLPDGLTLPLLWLGLLASLGGWFADPVEAIIGAAAGYLILWCVYHLFRLVTGKEGMGYGDFKLLAALGAWLGWQALPLIIILASGVGAVVGLVMTVSGRLDRGKPIPFGPFLAAAGWLALVAGDTITGAYFRPWGCRTNAKPRLAAQRSTTCFSVSWSTHADESTTCSRSDRRDCQRQVRRRQSV